ncbi:acetolactate synthase small subunit [Frateuria sp. YIM B11624]|uniref:acetolactate synthase small subunit n=1 Tax=Frateuria sp. YIM B11624 TaxID=3143185 RepID=UPI003C75247B
MPHTLSILLQNEAGTLLRVAGLFATRSCNIDALTVRVTEDPSIARMVLEVRGDAPALGRLVQKARRLVDVLEVEQAPP